MNLAKTVGTCMVMIGMLVVSPLSAQEAQAPDVLVKSLVDQTIKALKTDPALKGGNEKAVETYARNNIIPHVDTKRVTALAMGKFWRGANEQQRADITSAFTDLLTRTYSAALVLYKDYKIQFHPLRAQPSDTDAIVKTTAQQSGRPTVDMDYSLIKTDGGWKIYDIAVGGVSLVTNYRSMFAALMRDKGYEGIVEELRNKVKAGPAS